jgi:hypothetical protein
VLIQAIRAKTPQEVHAAVDGFAVRYVDDWTQWMAAPALTRPELFGRILRRWQATRPLPMRRVRDEANHEAPFLEDLLAAAEDPLRALGGLTVLTVGWRTVEQEEALVELWDVFSRLPTTKVASCVGITKSVLLMTDGRVGPAFDRQVRTRLGIGRPSRPQDWLRILEGIAADIQAFESRHGPLSAAVPQRFANLACGRLYDMALGPR